MSGIPDLDSFVRLATALEPWLGQAVIIGGWAHRLYRLHPLAQKLDYSPLMTLDMDIAVPARLAPGPQNIRQRLLAHGFSEELLGEERPPAAHYHLGDAGSGFYAEFLTPLTGSAHDRKGRSKATVEIAGVTTQQLRHIELLLNHPWTITLQGVTAEVHIANPVSFIVQKILIHKMRTREDRAKDILYIYDTLQVFGASLEHLRAEWRTNVAPQLQPRNASMILKAPDVLFGALSDDLRRAAEISAERALTPEDIRAACHYGISDLLA
jgi:hypothetical protein